MIARTEVAPRPRLRCISLGAGVQSSTLALMAAVGEIGPMPDCAIFADTQAEPEGVYAWLDWLEAKLPFKVYRVTAGDLAISNNRVRTSKDGKKYLKRLVPAFTGDGGLSSRRCTSDFKLDPIRKEMRRLANVPRGCKIPLVECLIGISFDEVIRMKQSREPWVVNSWPLVDLRMTRADCLAWMKRNKYPTPPRSACVFCPYHNDSEWRRLKREDPLGWADAVAFEKDLNASAVAAGVPLGGHFLHRSLKPLNEVDLSTDVERGQILLFNNECEGMCGV